jgi:hypothetical protein
MQKGADAGKHTAPAPHDPRTASAGGEQARAARFHDEGGTTTDASVAQVAPALGVGALTSRLFTSRPIEHPPVGRHPLIGCGGPQGLAHTSSEKNATVGGSHVSPCGREQLHAHCAGPPSISPLPS